MHQMTDPHHGLPYPESQTATWKSCNTMIQNTLQKEKRREATRDIGKHRGTRASPSKTQSNLMNNNSAGFIPIDERKWNDLLAIDDVKGKTLELRISKLGMKLVRHINCVDRELDGAVRFRNCDARFRVTFSEDTVMAIKTTGD